MVLGLPLAALVTAGLFLGMGALIKNDVVDDPIDPAPEIPSITRQIEDTPLSKPPERPDTTLPPEPVRDTITLDPVPHDGPPIVDPTPGPLPTTGDIGEVTITLDNAIISLVPDYPNSCLDKGIEGTATVKFDVTKNGVVTNARIVDASHKCFQKASLKAIRGWKFQVTGRGGNAIARRGLQKTFRFQISQ